MRLAAAIAAFASAFATSADTPYNGPSVGPRYATDAYPAFETTGSQTISPRKEPRWFSWFTGPKKDTPAEQFAWAAECEAAGNRSKAARAYDALVREWPFSKEAPAAQTRLAEIRLVRDEDFTEAFAEFRYLLDYYPLQCDYAEFSKRLYDTACTMRREGKRMMFMRFANTAEVRRAFEAVVLRAPGAAFAPAAMQAVAELREDDDEQEQAIEVYANLRSVYPGSREAADSYIREAAARMCVLRRHGYNRDRRRDTISFIRMALRHVSGRDARDTLQECLAEALEVEEREDWESAKFYDSPTRTKRTAADAYRKFLEKHPAGEHAPAARSRLGELEERMEK